MGMIFIATSIVSTLSPLLPLFIYWRIKANQAAYMKYLAGLLIVAFAADVVGLLNGVYFKARYVSEASSYVYYFFAIILITLLYRVQFPKRFHNWINVAMAVLLLNYCYWLFLNFEIIAVNDSKVPIGIITIIFSLMYFYQVMEKMPTVYVYKVPMFWINSGLLLYSAGTLILFLISNYMIYVLRKDMLEYWTFHNIMNALGNVLIAIGFWKSRTHPKSMRDQTQLL